MTAWVSAMTDEKEFEIFAALHEESGSPWVWLALDGYRSRDIIQIRCPNSEQSISSEVRIIDANFISHYNGEGRRHILEGAEPLVISEWYRKRLDICAPGNRVVLRVKKLSDWWGELTLYWHHPDRTVRLAVHLAILSVSLGLISLLIAIVR